MNCSLPGFPVLSYLLELAQAHIHWYWGTQIQKGELWWYEELTHWKRLWCWEGLGAGGEGDDRGWDGWMASTTQWTWVGVSSRTGWWTGRPGVLQFMGSQRVRHNWATDLIWSDLICFIDYVKAFDCVDHNKLWKILKEMGILDHLTCLLRILYAGQEVTVRIGHGTTDWFQIRKGVRQGCILSPCLFNLYAEYIMRNAGLAEAQAEIKIEKYQ